MAPGPLEVGWVGIWGRELGPGTRKGRKPSLFPVVFFFFFSLSFFSCYLCVCIMWFSEEEVGLAPPTLIPPPLVCILDSSPIILDSRSLGYSWSRQRDSGLLPNCLCQPESLLKGGTWVGLREDSPKGPENRNSVDR